MLISNFSELEIQQIWSLIIIQANFAQIDGAYRLHAPRGANAIRPFSAWPAKASQMGTEYFSVGYYCTFFRIDSEQLNL